MPTFSSLVTEYRTVTDKDKVRKNTANDFNFPRGWYYSSGTNINGVWTYLYINAVPEHLEEAHARSYDGIGSLNLFANKDGTVDLRFSGRKLGSGVVARDVTDIPDELQPFIHNWW